MEILLLLIPFGIFGFFFLIGIGSTILWLWSLIHCIRNRNLKENDRIIGVIVILTLGLIGSLIYLFIPRQQPLGVLVHESDPVTQPALDDIKILE